MPHSLRDQVTAARAAKREALARIRELEAENARLRAVSRSWYLAYIRVYTELLRGSRKERLMHRSRTEQELREALGRMCHGAWGDHARNERSVFTIPVDREHDADCTLADGIDELVTSRARIAWLESLLEDLYDDSPCRFDHHGYCQEHNWFSRPPCIMEQVRQALGKQGP